MKNLVLIIACCFLAGCIDASQVGEVPDSPSMGNGSSESQGEKIEDVYEVVPRLAWDGKVVGSEVWTTLLVAEIGKYSDLLTASPKDAAEFCPNYANLTRDQRILFYAQLISKTAEFESSFRSDRFFKECSFKKTTYGSSGKWIELEGMWCIPGHKLDGGVAISRGLMQMSLESAQGYGCAVEKPSDLHDPIKNLSCAVKVFNRFVPSPRIMAGKIRGHGVIASKVDGSWKGASAYWAVLRNSSEYNKESSQKIKFYTSKLSFCQK